MNIIGNSTLEHGGNIIGQSPKGIDIENEQSQETPLGKMWDVSHGNRTYRTDFGNMGNTPCRHWDHGNVKTTRGTAI